VYAVDAVSGQPKWQRPLLPAGSLAQAAPAGLFTRFGAPFDMLFVGTWNSGGNNRFYALDAGSGTPLNFFDNGGAPNDVGVVSAGAAVDYTTRRVYFTSRAAGLADTVWAFDASAAGISLAWSRAAGDIDAAPIVRGGRVYVGTGAGEIRAYDASVGPSQGTEPWSSPFLTLDGAVRGFLFPDRLSTDLYFTTDAKVWSIRDDGADAAPNWSSTVVPSPSIPLFGRLGGLGHVYVGGGDGRLYQLDAATGLQVRSIRLGDGLAAIGAPSMDVANGLVFVGSEAGILYAVQVPVP
jgi:outer membrane protein assembly factor BamB